MTALDLTTTRPALTLAELRKRHFPPSLLEFEAAVAEEARRMSDEFRNHHGVTEDTYLTDRAHYQTAYATAEAMTEARWGKSRFVEANRYGQSFDEEFGA